MIFTQTPQDTFNAAMDSVNLINAGNVLNLPTSEWSDIVARNKAHLTIQVAKGADYFGTIDLTPLAQVLEV